MVRVDTVVVDRHRLGMGYGLRHSHGPQNQPGLMVVPCLSAAWGMPIFGLNVEFRGCLFFVWTAPDMDISECDKIINTARSSYSSSWCWCFYL